MKRILFSLILLSSLTASAYCNSNMDCPLGQKCLQRGAERACIPYSQAGETEFGVSTKEVKQKTKKNRSKTCASDFNCPLGQKCSATSFGEVGVCFNE